MCAAPVPYRCYCKPLSVCTLPMVLFNGSAIAATHVCHTRLPPLATGGITNHQVPQVCKAPIHHRRRRPRAPPPPCCYPHAMPPAWLPYCNPSAQILVAIHEPTSLQLAASVTAPRGTRGSRQQPACVDACCWRRAQLLVTRHALVASTACKPKALATMLLPSCTAPRYRLCPRLLAPPACRGSCYQLRAQLHSQWRAQPPVAANKHSSWLLLASATPYRCLCAPLPATATWIATLETNVKTNMLNFNL